MPETGSVPPGTTPSRHFGSRESLLSTDSLTPDVARTRKWTTIAGLCHAGIGISTDGSVSAIGLPRIASDIHMMEYFGWSSSAFLLTACIGQPMFGRFYSHGYRKGPLLCGVLLYHLGAVTCASARSVLVFVLGRAISGAGAASLYVGTQAIIVSLFSVEEIALCLGALSWVSMVFTMAVPPVCGIIIDLYSWRYIFILSLPPALIGVGLLLYALPADEIPTERASWIDHITWTDVIGTAVLALAFSILLVPSSSYSVAFVSARLLVFGGLISVFGWLQYRNESTATIAPKVLMRRQVWISCIIACSLEIAIFIQLYYLPLFYQAVKNYSAKLSGVQETAYMFGLTSSALVSGFVVRFFGRAELSMCIGIASLAVSMWFLTGLNPQYSMLDWLPLVVTAAFGAGFSLQLPFVIVASSLDGKDKIVGNAIVVFSHSMGGPIGTSLAHLIFSNVLLSGLRNDAPEIDALKILYTGATELRDVVPQQSLGTVLAAYARAIDSVLWLACLAVAIAGLSAIFLYMLAIRRSRFGILQQP